MKFSKIRPDTIRQARERQELIFYWQRENMKFFDYYIKGQKWVSDEILDAWRNMRKMVNDLREEQKSMKEINTISNKIYWFIKDTLKIKSR